MSRSKGEMKGLSNRDKEFTAIGAAIASNCIPCIEYHIPQAKKSGLSDTEIREAVELADKVRRVPAHKVLQTAFAFLAEQNHTRTAKTPDACGCRDRTMDSGEGVGGAPAEPHGGNVGLDNGSPTVDSEMTEQRCSDTARGSVKGNGSDEASAWPYDAKEHFDSDVSVTRKMMQRCCPD